MPNRYLLVICAYSRPKALERLLRSLENNSVLANKFDVIVSIDYHNSLSCNKVAQSFSNKFSNFHIIEHQHNVGLKGNILSAAKLVENYDFLIMLEEDVWCHNSAFQFAIDACSMIKDEKVAQIALYSYQICQTSERIFQPLKSASDFYFAQIPCSSGQIWTKKQWLEFEDWLKKIDIDDFQIVNEEIIPDNVIKWSEQSWKKLFFYFLIDQRKYVAYPFTSYTTNMSDSGGTHDMFSHMHQVSILNMQYQSPRYLPFRETHYWYDSFSEINFKFPIGDASEYLNTYEFDIRGKKSKQYIMKKNKKYVITKHNKTYNKAAVRYSCSLYPFEQNIIQELTEDNGYFVKIKASEFHPESKLDRSLIMREMYYFIPIRLSRFFSSLHLLYYRLRDIYHGWLR